MQNIKKRTKEDKYNSPFFGTPHPFAARFHQKDPSNGHQDRWDVLVFFPAKAPGP